MRPSASKRLVASVLYCGERRKQVQYIRERREERGERGEGRREKREEERRKEEPERAL
jgi:hypothetical protein